ncbi:hypothetical protein DVY93_02220 [Psychrobacter sp. CCUG 69069]|jgi:hypothetical protein|uniref:hypothetical protein n=1 Tax=Psychrobacter TaxID=497 RepID=UPI0018E03B73|nr:MULTISPECIES: hypothetical protein [Psychrobacter]MCD1278580.1 hypothetical protein [Psychrobacter sp. CCUG 69069]
MSHSQKDEQNDLQKYLEEKDKQAQKQQQEQESQPLSAYDACVLKESAKIHELMAQAQGETLDR